eukprot:353206-Chlamydomonas_euryale.AAC.12
MEPGRLGRGRHLAALRTARASASPCMQPGRKHLPPVSGMGKSMRWRRESNGCNDGVGKASNCRRA